MPCRGQALGGGGGELLGVPGLRGPQHDDLAAGRFLRRGGRGPGRPGVHAGEDPVDPQGVLGGEGRVGRQHRNTAEGARAEPGEETGEVPAFLGGEDRRRGGFQAEGIGGARGHLRRYERLCGRRRWRCRCGHLRKRNRAHLELRLERQRIHRVARHRVDAQILAEQVVPVERRETAPRPHPVRHHRRQHGPPAPRGDLDQIALRDAERPRVLRVELHEGPGVQLVELRDLPGLGERVPLVLHPPGVEHERIVVVRHLGGGQMRARDEDAPTGGRRKTQPVVTDVPDGIALRPVLPRGRPLHGRLAQPLVGHPAEVPPGLRVPEPSDLLEDLLGTVVREPLLVPHRARHLRDDPPVGHRLPGRVRGRPGQREVALAVDEDALRLRPHRARQDDVGVGVRLGVGEHVLRDDELGGLETLDDRTAVGDRGDRVGADDPAGLDLPVGHLPEHLDGALPDAVLPQCPRRQLPHVLGERPLLVHEHRPLPRQTRAHVPHLAPAHGVGLTGEGERPGAGTADRPRRQMQIDQGVGVPGAVCGLVEPHGPAAHPPPARLADQPGGGPQLVLRDPGDLRDRGRGVVGEEPGQGLPALGVRGHELRVGVPALVQQMQQTVQQRQVGPRPDLQEQIGLRRGRGPSRIDDDQLGARLDPLHHPQEEDRMAVGHVRPDDEKGIRLIEVLVRPGRPVRPQRQLVAGARARHAQPRVRLDQVRPHEPLGQLVRQILRLETHLPGDVEGDRVRPVLVDDRPQPRRGLGDRPGHRRRDRLLAPVVPYQRAGQPPGSGEHVGRGRALGAEPPRVRRMRLVAGRLQDRAPAVRPRPDIEYEAAAHTAVRADGAHLLRLLLRPGGRGHAVDGTETPLRRCHIA